MKKKSIAITLVLCILILSATLVACNDDGGSKETPKDYLITSLPTVTAPENVPDYSLAIEWIDASGNSTTFVKDKPVAILFHGKTSYDVKEDVDVDADYYNEKYTSSTSTLTIDSTAQKWASMGFNLGIFHYEAFADDTEENINAKIYNASSMTYVNDDGITVVNTPAYNLTEAFVSAWTKISDDVLSSDLGLRLKEVRFMGNGVGACLALSAADYLEEAYNAGLISDAYLPARIDLIDPYLSNDGTATVIGYRNQKTLGSALEYNKDLIFKLTDLGTVVNIIESDEEFYNSYNTRYTGVEVTEPAEEGGETEVVFTDTGDYAIYKQILTRVAYLEFRETYSDNFDDYHKSRATQDWYLYTVRGSDDTSISSVTNTNIRPMIDGYNLTGTSVTSSVKYALTAWTSTVYLRTVRGHKYVMQKNSNYSGTVKKTEYVMSKFSAESYQTSDITLDEMYAIAGYVTLAGNDPSYVNLNRSARMSGVTVQIEASKTGENTEYYTVVTDKTGYYFLNLGEDKLGYSVQIKVIVPSREYEYATSGVTSSENYLIYEKNKISSASGANLTMTSTENQNFFIYFVNCGLKKI